MGFGEPQFEYIDGRFKRKDDEQKDEKDKKMIARAGLSLLAVSAGFVGTAVKSHIDNGDIETKLKVPAIEKVLTPEIKTVQEMPAVNYKAAGASETAVNEIKSFTDVVNFNAPKIVLDKKNCDALTNYWHKIYKEHKEYRERLETAYVRIAPWRAELEKISASYGVPKKYIFLAIVESDFDKKTSDKGAHGQFQITKDNAEKFGLKKIENKWDERCDPLKAAEVTAGMLKENFELTKNVENPNGDWDLALTFYNGMLDKCTKALRAKGLPLNYNNYNGSFIESEMNKRKKEIMENKKIPTFAKRKAFYKSISSPKYDLMQNFQYAKKINGLLKYIDELDAKGKYRIEPHIFTEMTVVQPQDIRYTTAPGDNLEKIAAKFGVSQKSIIQKNPSLITPEMNKKLALKTTKKERKKNVINYVTVRENQHLKIPNPQKPLTLEQIAKKENIDPKKIAELNPMFSLDDSIPSKYTIRKPLVSTENLYQTKKPMSRLEGKV